MAAHTPRRPMEHRAQFQIDGFQATERAFHPREILVSTHRGRGIGLRG
jgi:hypothetical protein